MQIVEDRRFLHQIPELGRDLPETIHYLEKSLAGLSCQVFSPMKGALCAFFDFGASSAIAFRSDADALPIREESGLSFASRHTGKMHACGHDGHMAILLELARQLNKKRELPRNVLLVFQPAEETDGGAKDLVDTGIFETYRVEAIFALHLWPDLPLGTVATRSGGMMSRSSEITLTVQGRSSHIAKAEQGRDAMAAMVEFYRQATALEQSLPPETFRLLKFGRMEAGTVRNAVAGSARLEGSLRTFEEELFRSLKEHLFTLAEEIGEASGCQMRLHFSEGYPAVWNDEALYEKLRAWNLPFQNLEKPVMITEDFSWYQQRMPGVFFFLGVGPAPALHAADFHFDDTVLCRGAEFFLELAEKYR